MNSTISIKNTENSRITFYYEGLNTNTVNFIIKDKNTQQIIYSDSLLVNHGDECWVSVDHVYSYIKNISINFNLDTGEIYNFPISYPNNSNRHTVVNDNLFLFDGGKNASMYTIAEVFYDKIYDTDYVKVVKDDIVVDLGANIGVFSVYAQNHHPKFIYSIEPSLETFKLLTKNTSQFPNIKCINAAITDIDGESYISEIPKESAINFLRENIENITHDPSKKVKFTKVQTFNINTLIQDNNIPKIDYLKVDIEGGELDLFKSINKTYLANNIKKIAIEYHTNEIKNQIISILEKCDFTIENSEIKNKNIICGMLYAYKLK